MSAKDITHIVLESIRAVIIGIVFFTAVHYGKTHQFNKKGGWKLMVAGFGFLLWGSLTDITDAFKSLSQFIIFGPTVAESISEKIIGYLLGFVLLAIGFWKWVPKVIQLDKTRSDLKTLNESLEILVDMRTEELNSLYHKLQKKDNIVQHELDVAAVIQRGIMPQHLLQWNDYRVMGFSMPMEKVGGDLFDYFAVDDNRMVIYAADVSGHGIPAALITTMLKISLTALCNQYEDPEDIVVNLNKRLQVINQLEDEYILNYLTLFIAVIDTEGRVTYSNGGHHLPIYYDHSQAEITDIPPTKGTIIGALEGRMFKSAKASFTIEVGDKLMFYTDGIIEKNNRNHEEFSIDGVKSALTEGIQLGFEGEQLLSYVFVKFNEFSDGLPNNDDITLILLEKSVE